MCVYTRVYVYLITNREDREGRMGHNFNLNCIPASQQLALQIAFVCARVFAALKLM